MKLIKGKPPIYENILKAGLKPTEKTVFTYGDSLYIQDMNESEIDPILLAHENIHTLQQGNDIDAWWDIYIHNTHFRYEQELEAYGGQYKYVLALNPPDKIKKFFLNTFATYLSSPMYGSLVSVLEAESKIRNKAKS